MGVEAFGLLKQLPTQQESREAMENGSRWIKPELFFQKDWLPGTGSQRKKRAFLWERLN